MGHVSDVLSLQPEAFRHLARTFMLDGSVDDSRFVHQAIDFTPVETFGETARRMLLWAVGIAAGVLLALTLLVWWIVRRHRRRRRLDLATAATAP